MEDNFEYFYEMMEDDSENYPDNEFNIEAAKNSVVPSKTYCLPETNIQPTPHLSITSLKDKEKAQKPKKKYKHKEPLFTHEYFEMTVNKNGEEVDSHEILDDKDIKK
ncbi:22512_t:CDS:2, partial [Dentiscutata erythropus]